MALWIEHSDANQYFNKRMNAEVWDALETTSEKTAALTTAQSDIVQSATETLPDDADATQDMKDAVCEQALFRLLDPDSDVRSMLINQGVTSSSIAGESFSKGALDSSGGIPLAPKVKQLMSAYIVAGGIANFDLTR